MAQYSYGLRVIEQPDKDGEDRARIQVAQSLVGVVRNLREDVLYIVMAKNSYGATYLWPNIVMTQHSYGPYSHGSRWSGSFAISVKASCI